MYACQHTYKDLIYIEIFNHYLRRFLESVSLVKISIWNMKGHVMLEMK